MGIVIEVDEDEGFERARKIAQLIGAHGRNMTEAAVDRALRLWDALLMSGLNCRMKATGTSANVREHDNHEQEVEKMEKSRREGLMARGRAFVKMGYCPQQAAKLALEIERKTGGRLAPASSTTGAVPKEKQPAAAPVMPRSAQVAPKPTPHSMGPSFWGYEKQDLSTLTPHQVAGMKLGVDLNKISAEELARMDGAQMVALGRQHQLEEVTERRNRELASYPPVQIQQWGTPNGFWRR